MKIHSAMSEWWIDRWYELIEACRDVAGLTLAVFVAGRVGVGLHHGVEAVVSFAACFESEEVVVGGVGGDDAVIGPDCAVQRPGGWTRHYGSEVEFFERYGLRARLLDICKYD